MAFKMKNQSMAKLTKAAGDSRVAMKMKAESAMKMKEKSPMEKELVGKQGNLPPELKAKIEAAPSKMKSAMKKNGDNDAKIKALQAKLAKAMKDGNDREVNAIRRQIKDVYESEKEGKGLEKSPAKMKEKSAMKKDLPGVTVTAEKGRKSDGSVDKNSQRYKDAVAAGKRKKENETKQEALDKKVKSGSDLSFAERTKVSQQKQDGVTAFTGKRTKPKKKVGSAVLMKMKRK